MEGGFPISLEGATFEEWGQYVVPSGAHKDKTFEAMVQDAHQSVLSQQDWDDKSMVSESQGLH